MKIAGAGSASGCRSVSQRYGSADPYPYQNVADPQYCLLILLMSRDSQLKALIFVGVAAAPDSATEGKKIKKKNSRLLSY